MGVTKLSRVGVTVAHRVYNSNESTKHLLLLSDSYSNTIAGGRSLYIILKFNEHHNKIKGIFLLIVKPKSKVPKSRPKGLGLTLKSHGAPHMVLHIAFLS